MKDAELGFGGQVAHVRHFQAVAKVGLVAAVACHSVVISEVREGSLQLKLRGQLAHQAGVQALNQVQHRGLVHEAHFQVKLGELRLPVGPQVFVAETAGNLEVAFHAAHHEQLLELLGRLRQGVEIAGLHPAGHEIIARAFRCALDEDGRFDFQETVLVQIIADVLHRAMTQPEVFLHRRPAQVQVAVAQAQAFVGFDVVGDVERRRLRLVEHGDAAGHYLDLARGKRGILRTFRPFLHRSRHLYAPLGAEPFRRRVIV